MLPWLFINLKVALWAQSLLSRVFGLCARVLDAPHSGNSLILAPTASASFAAGHSSVAAHGWPSSAVPQHPPKNMHE